MYNINRINLNGIKLDLSEIKVRRDNEKNEYSKLKSVFYNFMNLFIVLSESFLLIATKRSIPAFVLIIFSLITCQWGYVVHKSEHEIFYHGEKKRQNVASNM